MKNAAVICEFDPLHTGHEYLIKTLRERGAERIVCIMSGDACQRGELSVFSKHDRARAALAVGADLVLELPFPYSAASAEFFAFGAMSIIKSLGCIDTLGFGCESGDADLLLSAASIDEAEFGRVYREIREKEASLGAAAQMSLAYEHFGFGEELTSKPNNILAIEYIKAGGKLGLDLDFCAVRRVGAGHGEGESGGFASASYIRERVRLGELEGAFLPESCRAVFGSALECGNISKGLSEIGDAVLAHFRLLGESPAETAEASGGLLCRMTTAAHKARDCAEFTEMIKTKKYTDARLRRAVLFSLTDVREEDLHASPAYTTLLGATKEGLEMLAAVKKTLGIPLVSNPAMLRRLPPSADRQKKLCRAVCALRSLTCAVPTDTEAELRRPPVLK